MPVSKKSLVVWGVLGITGLVIFILFFSHAFPFASVDIRFSKEDALAQARSFVESKGFDLTDFDHAVIFDSDYYVSAYLQKTQGIKKSNEFIRQGIPVWFWRVRWFKELEKEGFIVDVDPASGEVVQFRHSVLDDDKGADLLLGQARAMAEKEVASQEIDLNGYELKDSTTRKQRNRTDYYFIWEKKGFKIKEATFRVKVEVYGDTLGIYKKYLKVPEGFYRELKKETSFGAVLAMISSIIVFILTMTAVFTLIIYNRNISINWKLGLIFGCILATLKLLIFLNNLPLMWSYYPDTMSKAVFLTGSFGNMLNRALMFGFIIFSYGILGELICRQSKGTKTPLFDALKEKRINFSQSLPICVIGYSLGFMFLGYVTLFYLAGTKFFNIWMPPDVEYSNILATAMPFLFPLTIALGAAISEEFTYRWFAVSFLKKSARLAWLAVLIPALIWAFGHSNYPVFPVYARAIELTIFGIALGVVFLKYGLETVLIAHFVINASIGSLPLLRSHSPYFFISGIITVALAFVPFWLIFIVSRKYRRV